MTDRSVIAYPGILHFSESRHYIREVSPANTMAYDRLRATHNNQPDHDRRWWKWAPRVPLKCQSCAPTRRIDRGQPPEQANVLRGGVDRVYAPQNASLFQR